MSSPDRRRDLSRSIVMAGRFNPAIFQPEWFVREGIIPESDLSWMDNPTEASGGLDMTTGFTRFRMRWGTITVTADQFAVTTTEQWETALAKDLVISTFTALAHTPVMAMGINHVGHMPIELGGWDALTERLAPSKPWTDALDSPEVTSLTMKGRREGPAGSVNVTLEASVRLESGVFMAINDHYDLAEEVARVATARPAIAALTDDWLAAQGRVEGIVRWLTKTIG